MTVSLSIATTIRELPSRNSWASGPAPHEHSEGWPTQTENDRGEEDALEYDTK